MRKAITKSTLLEDIASGTQGIPKSTVKAVMDEFVQVTGRHLHAGNKVVIKGFGTFEVRKRAGRIGRNPKTGAPLRIDPSKIVAFKANPSFRSGV
ncbi:MAG TPA: HU family DNA-binding protein [Nevskiaceae bacterium]|nr:HU family DNA-binding protein [Nevskiaceae bacterium]